MQFPVAHAEPERFDVGAFFGFENNIQEEGLVAGIDQAGVELNAQELQDIVAGIDQDEAEQNAQEPDIEDNVAANANDQEALLDQLAVDIDDQYRSATWVGITILLMVIVARVVAIIYG